MLSDCSSNTKKKHEVEEVWGEICQPWLGDEADIIHPSLPVFRFPEVPHKLTKENTGYFFFAIPLLFREHKFSGCSTEVSEGHSEAALSLPHPNPAPMLADACRQDMGTAWTRCLTMQHGYVSQMCLQVLPLLLVRDTATDLLWR